MCIIKAGEIIKIEGRKALVKFGEKMEEINISLLKGLRVKDKIVCSGKIAIEKLED